MKLLISEMFLSILYTLQYPKLCYQKYPRTAHSVPYLFHLHQTIPNHFVPYILSILLSQRLPVLSILFRQPQVYNGG